MINLPADEIPTDEVISMIQQGLPNEKIIQRLQDEGYTYQQISDALSQAETKVSIEGMPPQNQIPQPLPPESELRPSIMDVSKAQQRFQYPQFQPPQPQQFQNLNFSQDTERIEEIAESIISEKWQKALEEIGDLNAFKEKIKTDTLSIKQEILRIESRFENLQKAILGKIQDYDKGISDVGTEIKALEKLLQNIISPLTTNVKELTKLTEKLKKK